MRGFLDSLVIDGAMAEEAKREKRDLLVAWIDYRKAYDLVPHRWIIKVLRAVSVPKPIRLLVKRLITNGFQTKHQASLITHLMYMDDLKVCAKARESLEEVVRLVEGVSGAMRMELVLKKCAVAHMVQGAAVMAGGIPLKAGKEMYELEEEGFYRYLGVAQRFGADLGKTRQGVEKEYVTRIREIWGSRIDERGKIKAQNMWGTEVLRHSLGTVDWTQSNVKELDRATRRIMRQCQVHQYGASVARL